MKTLDIIFIIMVSYFLLFFMIGILEGSSRRVHLKAVGCEYKSYASLYNPAFILGCEFVKDRTK